jgi:putative hydrolase of the HAD superfamily
MPIRAVIVDVDGVLVDGRPEDGRPWSSGLEEDLGISKDVLDREFFQAHWQDVVLGHAPLMERLAPVLEKIAPRITVEQFIAYWFSHDSRIALPLKQELMLIRSVGIKVYLATNQEHARASYLMYTLGLSECCDGMFYSAKLSVRKPNPDFFARICSLTGLQPEELILIDDTVENVKAASALGWRTIHWTSDTSPEALREAIR